MTTTSVLRLLFLAAISVSCALAQPPPPASQFLYVANRGVDNMSGYSENSTTGVLTPIPGSPFGVVGSPWSLALHPSGNFVYATGYFSNTGINGYAIDPQTGALSPIPGSPFAALGGNQVIAIQPSGKFAYVTNGGGSSVSVYTIDSRTGALTFSLSSALTPLTRQNILVHPSGRFVYTTQDCVLVGIFCSVGAVSTVFGYAADPNTGALTPVPGSPFAAGQAASSLAADPTGAFLYVASAAGQISAFRVGASTGALAPIPGSPFAPGSTSPLAIAISPKGNFVYIPRGDGMIWGYTMDPTSGVLTLIPGSPFGAGRLNLALTVDCAGKFVYASDWYLSTVSAYAINAQTGALTAVPGSPFPAGNSPEAVVATCPAVLPPAISNVSASHNVLWPPNHDFVNVTISYDVASTISATCNLNVSSNEPGSGEWDVEDANHVLLRAERNGSGMGRIYTVTIDCVNAEGNATAETLVVVPHDQRQ